MPQAAMAGRQVHTSMTHVVRGETARFHPGDRARSYWPGEEHQVVIHDMRPIRHELSFDRNGFVLVDEPTDVNDFADKAELARYARATEGLIARLTGASKVVSFGAIVRSSASGAPGHNQPAFGAHVDYGARTVADFAADLLPPEEAERRLAGRHMLINVWRPLATVASTPLALCDASTVDRADLFDSEVIGGLGDFGRPSLWGFNLAYAPGQRWYWAPRMQPTEALAFKLFDSLADKVQLTAHSAFNDPATPADAPPRKSVELRTIAVCD